MTWRRPISSPSRRASASSAAGYVSESAVTSMARSPSASLAARASSAESTPPEKATTTPGISRRIASSRSYFAVGMSVALQADQVLELLVAPVDVARVQPRQPVQREVLDRERGHHRAVHHRASQRRRV